MGPGHKAKIIVCSFVRGARDNLVWLRNAKDIWLDRSSMHLQIPSAEMLERWMITSYVITSDKLWLCTHTCNKLYCMKLRTYLSRVWNIVELLLNIHKLHNCAKHFHKPALLYSMANKSLGTFSPSLVPRLSPHANERGLGTRLVLSSIWHKVASFPGSAWLRRRCYV